MAKLVGERVKRTEDPRLISGLAHYADDIDLPGLLHVAFVRSMYAHARINSINIEAVRDMQGVVAVFTGQDIKDVLGMVPVASQLEGLKVPFHPAIAIDKVCYVGEPIAAVVATDRYIARDAAELIEVDYDPLDPVVDPEAAVVDGSPRIIPGSAIVVVREPVMAVERLSMISRTEVVIIGISRNNELAAVGIIVVIRRTNARFIAARGSVAHPITRTVNSA